MMPSSFVDSVPPTIKTIISLDPERVIDVGPGWGKYGLMCKEYLPNLQRVEAVEVREGYRHTQDCIYSKVIVRDVRDLPEDFWEPYDLVLMIDVIEHMEKEEGQILLKNIVNCWTSVLVSTPKIFEEQHDPSNPYETHVSHWEWDDFWYPGMGDVDKIDSSTIDSMIITLVPV